MKQRMWTQRENAELARMAQFATAKTIAIALGRTAGGVQEHARLHGIRLLKHGTAHYAHKLTESDIAEIRTLAEAGTPVMDIANRMGVHKVHIYNILSYNRRWRESMRLDAQNDI